ncbi:hydrolase, alpha/beta domain protein [Mobiluncus holmesii ATCC 35242]|uniref:Hydrolase, alpha/beta domain protein n=2 Tax=Mobiluncus holmesii TaxID=144178 RepID=E6M385_9ACTO|nr:alpha/beta fold hydrolase [Mobiluncus holmesii]EFU82421.1 hydrolase, alpha/beta domain protein [Mobiluncus holmesii ATCC 35242]STY88610.1 Proline iminopeptidase [Mobiluncus holmesii]
MLKHMSEEVKLLPGLKLREITLQVPLDHRNPAAGMIDIFARVVTGQEGEKRPYLLFLQGGPGHEAARPSLYPSPQPSWLPRALEDYQVVMLDQRGTGRSTPVSADLDFGPLAGLTPSAQAEYLTHLRADEIVRDAEALRAYLGGEPWTLLGQSFGGFTSVRYLSSHPEGLSGAILTGGLTAVGRPIEDIYAETWRIMMDKSETYYRRFPEDRDRVRQIYDLAQEGKVVTPNGDKVGADWWRTVGIVLGAQGGGMKLHELLENDPYSPAFRHDLADMLPFGGRNPLYAILHESCYADGVSTRWAASRTMPPEVKDDGTFFAGEHLPRDLFEESSELRPLRETAEIIANQEWEQLYSATRLASADVPVAAAAYYEDAYVPLRFSVETARLLKDCRLWVTSEYEHNGLRQDPRVLDRLIGLLKGQILQ